jgi:hypothetical protein
MRIVELLTAETVGVDLGQFGQYGVLGLFCSVMLWVLWRLYQRELTRADRLEAKNEELNDAISEKVIPLLTTATAVIQEFQRAQREDELRRLSALDRGRHPRDEV